MWKKIAIGAGVLLLICAGALVYLWRQATALPDWYEEEDVVAVDESVDGWVVIPEDGDPFHEELLVDPAPEEGAAGPTGAKKKKPRKRNKASKGARRELRSFHRKTKIKDPTVRSAAKASRAIYEDGQLEAGVVLDMSKIDRKKLDEKGQAFYDKALKAFPSLKRKEVYIAIEDTPGSKDGYLVLSDDAKIRIGNLEYSLEKAAKKVGVSPKKMRRQLNKEMKRLKMRDPNSAPPPEEDLEELMEAETAI